MRILCCVHNLILRDLELTVAAEPSWGLRVSATVYPSFSRRILSLVRRPHGNESTPPPSLRCRLLLIYYAQACGVRGPRGTVQLGFASRNSPRRHDDIYPPSIVDLIT